MAKRQADHAEDSIQGYIHEVSPIKISRANNPYFTGKIQVNTNTFQKIVCFDQSKHAELKSASAARTPIKLCDIRNVPSREDSSKIDILVNSKTTINAVRTLDFRCHNDSNSECSTKTIEEIELTPEKNQIVNFLIVNNQEDLKDDPDRIEDFLLNQEKISVEFGKNNVIENIQIEH
ncbi:uncharacterized protein LOC133188181 [Saccostrea echinata]|uniref:uncharacterized protein LOC133188181 n=1 Tax=Saccostrea echinata TaxID=191078 RepID=UPI002A81DD16|nr:uncharacterized protein LOC133188181 [Saccostrea echinata]